MQLAGQSDTGAGREEGDGPVLQNGKAEESGVSRNGLNLPERAATVKASIAPERVQILTGAELLGVSARGHVGH